MRLRSVVREGLGLVAGVLLAAGAGSAWSAFQVVGDEGLRGDAVQAQLQTDAGIGDGLDLLLLWDNSRLSFTGAQLGSGFAPYELTNGQIGVVDGLSTIPLSIRLPAVQIAGPAALDDLIIASFLITANAPFGDGRVGFQCDPQGVLCPPTGFPVSGVIRVIGPTAVPEPRSLELALLGASLLGGTVLVHRRRKLAVIRR